MSKTSLAICAGSFVAEERKIEQEETERTEGENLTEVFMSCAHHRG